MLIHNCGDECLLFFQRKVERMLKEERTGEVNDRNGQLEGHAEIQKSDIINGAETKHKGSVFRTTAGCLVLALTPAAVYMIFEGITGNLGVISIRYTLLNLAAYYLIYILLFAVAGTTRIAYPLLNTIMTAIALAEHFVVEFRGRPIMLGDVMALRTAMTVSGNYHYVFTAVLIIGIMMSLLLSGLAVLWPVRVAGWKYHGGAFVAAAAVTLISGWWFYGKGIAENSIEINMWDPANSYRENGYVLSTLYAFSYISTEPPEGYSVKEVQNIGRTISDEYRNDEYFWNSSDSDVVPVNMICIMNESFADLSVIGDFQTDKPYLENYYELSDNCIKGNLYMPVFGAMTCNSEYEFLTGNAMSFAPPGSVPYQVYANQTVYGLPLTLKNQGYRTVAMHPYPAQNWNRNQVFAQMGFDEFLAEEYFDDSPRIRGYVSDRGTYDKIIGLTEEKEPGERLFIFDVTMQNHGGYTAEGYESQVHLEDFDDMPKTEQYLSLIRESDEALKYLLDYYEECEEPTMIVMFGDHQPGIEEEFYEAVYGMPLYEVSSEDYIRRYITPFLVWTNYDMPSETIEGMSAAYLSSMVVERANLEPTDFQVFLDKMYQQAPVIHPLGYYSADGIWSDWIDWKEKKEYPIFKNYYILQYNNMMGKKRRVDDIFRIAPVS